VEYRRLGKSGLQVSELGFGGHQTGGYRKGKFEVPLQERARIIERSLELGVTYFDTTTGLEAASLSSAFSLLGGKPDHVTVACMYTDYKLNHEIVEGIEDKVRQSIDDNLRHFDPIDVFNLCGNGFRYCRERTVRALDALQEARARGKVRHFGFSTHVMQYALEMIGHHPEFALLMLPFNRVLPRIADKLFPLLLERDVALVGMKVFGARGFFDLGIDPGAYGPGLSVPVAAIRWVLQHEAVACTIPAMNSMAELEENASAPGTPLGAREAALLDDLCTAFEARVRTDPKWYFHRDWTRRLYGEDEVPAEFVPGSFD